MTQPTHVMIRFELTLEMDGFRPIQISKLVPIKLGTHMDGSPMLSLTRVPEKLNAGVMEVRLQIPSAFSPELPHNPLQVVITSLAANGGVKISRIDSELETKSPVYTQLEAIQAALELENSELSDRMHPPFFGNPS